MELSSTQSLVSLDRSRDATQRRPTTPLSAEGAIGRPADKPSPARRGAVTFEPRVKDTDAGAQRRRQLVELLQSNRGGPPQSRQRQSAAANYQVIEQLPEREEYQALLGIDVRA